MKTAHSLILASLLAATAGARAQNYVQNEEELETAIFVLAQPEDRAEVKYLLNLSKTSGLNENERSRLFDITKDGLNKLRNMSQPMLSSKYSKASK